MIRHFGVLIPSTNTTVEIEYNRFLPPSLQVHVGRLGKAVNTPFSPSRDEDIEYQSRMLGTAQVEVVCLAQTSASLFDDDYDAAAKQRMTEGAGVPSLTSAEAIGQAGHYHQSGCAVGHAGGDEHQRPAVGPRTSARTDAGGIAFGGGLMR